MRNAETWRRLAPIGFAILAIVIGYALSVGLASYYVFLGTTVIIATINLLGLGVVTGRAGMVALCQLSFGTIGAWIVSGLNVIGAPGGPLVWIVIGTIVTGAAGTIVGLPALRLRGVNLAVVTLGFAAALHTALLNYQFPGSATNARLQRPEFLSTDREFFFFALLVLVACALILSFLQRSRMGSGWLAVAFSERATAAAGSSVRLTKLSAFTVSALLGGLAGGLLTMQVGLAAPASFAPLQSLALYVLAVVTGSHLIDMAVFGGLLWVAVPEILKRLGIPQDWGFVVFGAMGIQALTTHSTMGQDLRDYLVRIRERRRVAVGLATAAPLPLPAHAHTTSLAEDGGADDGGALAASSAGAGGTTGEQSQAEAPGGESVLTLRDLTVDFGKVRALDAVDLEVHAGSIVGLIGPNGAGKSTLVDAVSGFQRPTAGAIALEGKDLAPLAPTARARRGLRRTFQQDRVPPTMTVGAYLRFVARRDLRPTEIAELLRFIDGPSASLRLTFVPAGMRRTLEVIGHVASRPHVVLLDEPAAGLSHAEHVELGERLRQLPATFETALLLIEHDMDLIRSVCPVVAVLDHGALLAYGPQHEVLSNPAVLKAYMGEEVML